MKSKRHYTKEFKEETDKVGSKSQVAHDLGIHVSLIGRWQRELKEEGDKAFPGRRNPEMKKWLSYRLKEEAPRRGRNIKKSSGSPGRSHRDAVSSAGAPTKIPIHRGA